MSQTVAIHQPNYIPWLGYFYKIYSSDVFVFLDDVQFSNEGMHNYHYLKTPEGAFRLKIPVEQHMGDLIMDVKTKDHLGWKEKHLKIIESNYKKTPYFGEVFDDFASIIRNDYQCISDMNIALIQMFLQKFKINTKLIRSSTLNLSTKKEDKVIDICSALNATVYYSGTGAKAYQNEEDFLKKGIELRYMSFNSFEYNQLWNAFQANVSVIDYVMNCGYNWDKVVESQNTKM